MCVLKRPCCLLFSTVCSDSVQFHWNPPGFKIHRHWWVSFFYHVNVNVVILVCISERSECEGAHQGREASYNIKNFVVSLKKCGKKQLCFFKADSLWLSKCFLPQNSSICPPIHFCCVLSLLRASVCHHDQNTRHCRVQRGLLLVAVQSGKEADRHGN